MSGPGHRAGRPRGGAGWRRPPSAGERAALLRDTGTPAGLCAGCLHLRLLRSGRSRFVRCGLAETDPAYPRYPELPVLACAGYRRWDAGDENGDAGQKGAGRDETGGGGPGDGAADGR